LYTSGYNRSVSNYQEPKNLSQADASFKNRNQVTTVMNIVRKRNYSKSDWDKAVASYEVAKQLNKPLILMYKAPRQLSMKQRQSRTYYHLCSTDGTISMLNVELGERV
jgi:hypothetical protein